MYYFAFFTLPRGSITDFTGRLCRSVRSFWATPRAIVVFRQNSFASATVEIQPGQQIAASGPYAIIRHPMYSSAVLLFVGSALALGSYWAVLVALVMVGLMAAWLLDEEQFLRGKLAGYDEYCRKVRYRLLPWVW